jgi:hypothetical protein
LYEYAASNLEWLDRQVTTGWPSWGQVWNRFWSVLHTGRHYSGLGEHPRRALARRVEVMAGSVFSLDPAVNQWDMGTMFFVAESITAERGEFVAAVRGFLRVLRPGAPFAIAFMENSIGYRVAGIDFPAVSVRPADVVGCLLGQAIGVVTRRIPVHGKGFRPGYSGMIVACGRSVGARYSLADDRGGSDVARRSFFIPEGR